MCRRIKFEKHEASLFLVTSASARFVIATRSTGQDVIMNQEWYCTSKAIAQVMIVVSSSIYDELKAQVGCFIKVAVTQLFCCTTTCRQAHWIRWSLLQVKFLFDRKPPTPTKPEATPGDSIDLRMSGQPEEPHTLNEI